MFIFSINYKSYINYVILHVILNSFCKIQEAMGNKKILIITLVKIPFKSKHAITYVLQTFRTNTATISCYIG